MIRGRALEHLRQQGLEVLVSLHRGGMGEVLLARRKGAHGFDRLVAVKVIRPDLATDDRVRSMFLDEARVLAHLDHPAVAQVQDFGEVEATPFLVLEYVRGVSLSRLLKKREDSIPPPVAARMVAEIARGLHAVHEQRDDSGRPLGIVHRDISPQNLMFGFGGRMKLLDFGIALVAERRAPRTSTGLVKGKITYVAPEQISGLPGDRRTDVYSLCVVLHELLTGFPLFTAQSSPLAAAQERRKPPRPSRFARVPKKLDRVVMRGLMMEPDERYPDARELAIALESYASRAGGEMLEAFAEAELGEEAQSHEGWVRTLVSSEPELVPPLPPEIFDEVEEESELEVGSSFIEAERRVPVPRRRWRPAWLLFFAGLVGLGVFGYQSGRLGRVTSWLQNPTVSGSTPDSAIQVAVADTGSRLDGGLAVPTKEPAEAGQPKDENQPTAPVDASAEAPRFPPEAPSANGRQDPTPAAPKPNRTPAQAKPREPERRSVRSKQQWGRVTLKARRGGWVLVNGQPFGRTPLVGARIRAGRHRIALQRPGDDKPRWSSWVTVHPDKHVRIRLE